MSPGLRFAVLLMAAAVPAATGSEWSYKESAQWQGYCQLGNQQSPIDLAPAVSQVTQFDKLTFSNYDATTRANLINNGHTVEMQVEKPTCALSGGALPGVYYLSALHFHWGAEHTVQGRRLPLELHLVHYSKQYSGVSEAVKYKTGLAVIGILFKESTEANKKLDPLIAALKEVDGKEGSKFPMSVTPSDFFPGDLSAFYRYQGSLTTPGCNESVVWTVMMATVPVSKKQLESFVSLKSDHGMIGENYRPTQKLNGRVIIASKPPGSAAYRITPLTLFIIPVFIVFI